MLRIRISENKNHEMVATGERISFRKPAFITDENIKAFREAVFAWSDERQLETLTNKSEEKTTVADELKREYLEENNIVSGYSNDKLVKLVGFGLDFGNLKSENDNFPVVYNKAVKYRKKYHDSIEWDENRKKEFNAVRDAMINCFNKILQASVFDSDFELKISSKHVESFMTGCYGLQTKTDGKIDKKRGQVWKAFGMLKGYKAYCKAVTDAVGIYSTDKKTIVITESEEG